MRYRSLTLERLKEMLNYDPETGVFTWRQRPIVNSRKRVGDVAGSLKGRGYRYIGIDSHTYLASQLAWFYIHGEWAPGEVDTKNKNPADLRAENLFAYNAPPGEHENGTAEGRSEYRKAYREAFPDIHRSYNFVRYYGITSEEYQRLFRVQGGVCAICAQPERAKTPKGELKWLSVDHCHTTKAVRGLLCAACNHMIGHATDDPALLRKAADYLERQGVSSLADTVTEGHC